MTPPPPIYCHIVPPVWTLRHPDMGAAFLTEFLRQRGYQAFMLDLNAELFSLEHRPLLRACWEQQYINISSAEFCDTMLADHGGHIRARLQGPVDAGCRFFGIMLVEGNLRLAARLSLLIKELAPDAHVIAGGPAATGLYRTRRRYKGAPPLEHGEERELDEGHAFDSWVLGEGELTLLELLTRLREGQDLSGVRGLVRTEDGPMVPFKERALIKDLSILPIPTFEGVDLGLYDRKSLPFQLSRGCAFSRCSHCWIKGYSRGFRVRPPGQAVDELEHHIQQLNIRNFFFVDMSCNGDLPRLEEFCDEVIRRGLQIEWKSFAQIHPDMTPTLMQKVVASGCTSLNYGFESGSDKVLQSMRKCYSVKDAEQQLRISKEAGLRVVINIMTGHPEETEEEFDKTLRFLEQHRELYDDVASVQGTMVHLNSPLLDERESFGVKLMPGGTWVSTDGQITVPVRNERVHRVAEVLRLMGMGCHSATQEPRIVQARVEVAADLTPQQVEITSLQLVSHGDDTSRSTEDGLLVRVGYINPGRVIMAVFDLELLDLQGRPVFTTPRSSAPLREKHVHHEGWMQLALAPFDLHPGRYLLRARAWCIESGKLYDQHLRREPIELLGRPTVSQPVTLPYTWSNRPGPAPAELHRVIRQVRVTGGELEQLVLRCDEPLEVRVKLGAGAVGATCDLRLRDHQGRHLLESPGPLLTGDPCDLIWAQGHADLSPGRHELEVIVRDGSTIIDASTQALVLANPEPPQPVAGVVCLEPAARWSVPSQPEGAAQREPEACSDPTLHKVSVLPDFGPHSPLFAGDEITIMAYLLGLSADPRAVVFSAWVTTMGGDVLAQVVEQAVLACPAGAATLELTLRLNLLEGHYRLCCAAHGTQHGDGAELNPAQATQTFELHPRANNRLDGGGMVLARHNMSARPLPSPGGAPTAEPER